MLMDERRSYSRRPKRQRRLSFFWRSTSGVAAAEAVMLALVFIGLGIMVGKILKPAIQTAARNLNQELAGGASH